MQCQPRITLYRPHLPVSLQHVLLPLCLQPYLGKVAIVQPLLMNCLVARLSNEDDELERLVQYLLVRG